MITGIDHIEMVVRNVDEYVKYFELLGFKLIRRYAAHHGSAEMQLPTGGPIFELHGVQGEENPGINHIAFQVDDVAATYQGLVSAGVVFEKAPFRNQITGRELAQGRDPDGWRLQLVGPHRLKPQSQTSGTI